MSGAELDPDRLLAELDTRGHALTGALLSPDECAGLVGLYDDDARFRARVVMSRHGFGEGDYGYLADPLPPAVQRLRTGLCRPLAVVANEWAARLGAPERYPADLDDFLTACRRADQDRPTPLVLRYEAGGYKLPPPRRVRRGRVPVPGRRRPGHARPRLRGW